MGRPGLRLVNRQPGAGTRTLLDHHLRRERLTGERIIGYGFVVPTHLAAAAAVAEGEADVALGLYAAARAYGLEFVPLAHERYDLVFPFSDRDRPPLSGLLDLLRTPAFRALVSELGGYDTQHTGVEICL